MGQIVGLNAKCKRANLNALGSIPTPAAGEYILVSSDNSMNAAGQGNFDCYIVGDGRTAATALELKYLDDSTRPYIVEEVNKAVADIQPIEITGDVTNAPDEEDLTSENQGGTDVLKLKDKAYNSALYSGLGRVYLRKNIVTLEGTGKNILTQAMVNTANTIYHIQYDYDLNGETITIPEGCLLEFEGGSLGNGSVNANELNVISNGKCFNNIKFVGACKNRSYVNLSWFIDKYPTSTQDLSIDNTNDFKMCVSSGAHNIVVPTNKFIHLTDTIEFTEATNLLVESNNDTNFEAFSSGNSANYEQFTSPCIFSKEVVRLFDYKVANHTETDTSNPITIGGFNIYVDVPFSELTDSSIKTPIINVESAGADIWGLNIDTNIRIKRHAVSVPVAQQKDDRTIDLVCNYTGILLNANNGYMSMIRINGNIYGAHYCIRTISNTESSKNWFTDLILNGSTYGAYGGIFSVTPVSIYNNHQTHIMPNEYNTTGYFNGSIIRCYGFVWDCGMTSPRSKWKSAAVPVRFGANINDQFIVQALDENTGYYRQYPTVITRTRDILKEKADAFYNILRDWKSPLRRDMCAITSFIYTFDGVDIFTHPELVVNSDRLFNEFYNKENMQQSTTSRFAAYTANYVSSIHIEFVLSTMLLTGNGNREMPLFIFRMFRNTRKYSISISYCSTVDGTYIEFVNRSDVSASYYPFNEYVYQLNQGDGYYKITIDLSSVNGVLPAMIVPQFNRPFTELMAGTTTNRPNIVSARFGVPYFDTSVNKPVYWNGSNWYDALGNRDISDGTVQYSRISKVAREAKRTLRIEMDSPSNLFILKIGTISRESVFLVNTTTATTGGLTTVRSVTLLAGSVKCGDFIYFKDTAANKHVIECTSTQKLGDYEDYYIFPITTGTITIQGLDSSSYDESTCKGETPIAVVFGHVGSAPSIMPWTGSSMFSTNLGIPIFGDGYSRAVNALGQSAAKIRGTSGQRPILTEYNDKGYCYFDTGLGTPIWWNGTLWINQDGISIATKRNGTKAQRPSGSSIYVGFQYLQVDSTNGTFPIWASAISGDTVTWVKADGSNPDA